MAPHSGLPDPPTPNSAAGSLILSPDPKIVFSKGSQSSKALACSILCHCMVLHLHFTLSGHRNHQSGGFSSHSGRLPLRCPTPSRLEQLSNPPEQSWSSLTGQLRGEHRHSCTLPHSPPQLKKKKNKTLPGSTGLRSLRITCDWSRKKAGLTQRPC